ncbi:MAG TPA: hypothetical protein VL358_01065 [Caulobacteraceae bacterium]|jgi:hypothetical protein|nr:hypothetical protein [Caulobacteraceae bacterium]
MSPSAVGGLLAAALAGVVVGAMIVKPPGSAASVGRPPEPSSAAPATDPFGPETLVVGPTSPPAMRVPAEQQPISARSYRRPGAAPRLSRPAARAGAARTRGCCTYEALRAADRRLRQSYQQAILAGVSHATLVAYRDRWADLRRRAKSEPERMVSGYGVLATGLAESAHDARVGRWRAIRYVRPQEP